MRTCLPCIVVAILVPFAMLDAAPPRTPRPSRASTRASTNPSTRRSAQSATQASTLPATNPNILARVKLPAPVDATAVGGGGKYLVLHLKKLKMLAVFDVAQAKVLKYLPMPNDDLVFAAGAEKLFVGLKDLKQIQRWDLGKLELETTTPAPEGGIVQMAMGADAVGPLMLIGNKRFWQIDPATLAATRSPSNNWGTDGSAWGPTNVHVSFDGSTVVACGGGWAGVELASIAGGVVIPDVRAGGYVEGDALVAGNGALVFTGGSAIVRNDLTSQVTGIEGQAFPADDPAFSLALEKRGKAGPTLTLFSNGDPRPLLTLTDLPELADANKLPLWQRIHLIPSQKVLVTLSGGSDELVVHKFDLLEQLASSGSDYLFVESAPLCTAQRGTEYSYAIKVRAKRGGIQAELQAGPAGMKLDADGTLRWTAPTTAPQSGADSNPAVIIKVNDAAGQTVFQTFTIRITGAATPAAPTAPTAVAGADAAAAGSAVVIKLAEPFAEFHSASAGRKLVFFEKRAKRLVIYDADNGKELGAIPVAADDIQFACGRDAIIVALPAQKILQRYDLKTLQRTKSAPIPDQRPLRKIKMGSDSTGLAFLYFGGELVCVDSTTLATVSVRGGLPSGDPKTWFDYRVSSDGSTIVSWDSYSSPSGYSITRIKNGAARTIGSADSFSMAGRNFTPTADGSSIFYGTSIFDGHGRAVASQVAGYNNYIPTSDPRFFIAVRNGEGKKTGLALCTTNERRIVAAMDQLPEIGDGDAAEPRAIFSLETDNVVLIPTSNDQFQIRKLNLPGAMAGADKKNAPATPIVISLPPAEAVVGSVYTHQVQLLPEAAAVKYKVESAPEGLRISSNGQVTWKPIQRPVGGTVNVILTIVDAAGREVPHSFDIAVVRRDAPASDANPRTGEIVKVDDRRVELPAGDYRIVPGLGGRALILSGNQLAIVAPDGLTIQKTVTLPRSYVSIGEREDYFVAISQEPRSIDVIDKKTLNITRSRAIAFNELLDLKLHPTMPISYVSYLQAGEIPRHHFLIFEEATAEARTDVGYVTSDVASTTDLAFHPILPLVACFGKGAVVVFDRETGSRQPGRVNDAEIPAENIDRIYFAPDGRSIILQTTVNSIKYLYRLPLNMSADEQKQVSALPRPDKRLGKHRRQADDQERPRKLPQSEARAGDAGSIHS